MFPKNETCGGCALEHAPSLSGRNFPELMKVPPEGVPLLVLFSSPDTASIGKDYAFYSSAEHLVETLLKDARDHQKEMEGLNWRMEYAIPCGFVGRIPKGTDGQCKAHLLRRVEKWRPKTILALGVTATKMLGIKVQKFSDVRGKPVEVEVGGHRCLVVPTFEPYQVHSNPGLFRVFRQDIYTLGRFAGKARRGHSIELPSIEKLTKDYPVPKTLKEVKHVCDEIIAYTGKAKQKPETWPIVFDIETNSLETWSPAFKVIAIAFGWDKGKATTIMLDHKKTPYNKQRAWKHVRRVLECAKPKMGHNLPFDLAGLELAVGCPVRNIAWDTLMGEHLLDEDKKGHYGLKTLTPTYCPQYSGYEDKLWDQLIEAAMAKNAARVAVLDDELSSLSQMRGVRLAAESKEDGKKKGKKKKDASDAVKKRQLRKEMKAGTVTFEDVDVDLLCCYAGLDADITWQIFVKQNTLMNRESPKLYPIMRRHYLPGARAIADIQHRGVKVDLDYMSIMERDMDSELGGLLHSMYALAGREFNPNAKKDLQAVVLTNLALPPLGYTDTGQLKVDKEIIKRYIAEVPENTAGHQFMVALERYKSIHKGRTGFLKSIRALVDMNGFLHGSYHLNGTETGRLSSSSPNMQNWAKFIGRVKKDGNLIHAGYNLKKLLIPSSPSRVFFNMDYSGAEIRVFCAYTHDEDLIKAIHEGLDVHSYITSLVAKVSYETVEPGGKRPEKYDKLRDKVKRVVFGTLYGGSVHTMAAILKIDVEEAQEIVDAIFGVLPSLPEYISLTEGEVIRQGWVETFFGRRRHFRLAQQDRNHMRKCFREASNFKIQSTSSDITFGQLLEIHRELPKLGGQVLGTVHDSVFGEIEAEAVSQLHPFFRKWAKERVAERYPWLPVPFDYELEVGPSYGELDKMKEAA